MKTRLIPPLLLASVTACSPVSRPTGPDSDVVWAKMLKVQENFPSYDTDGDDRLSHQEVRQAMIRSGSPDTSDRKVSKVIAFYDFDEDGKISLREAQSGAVSGPEELIKQTR